MPDLIDIDQSICINYRYTRMKCQSCRNACPVSLQPDEQLGVRCTDCGLCISACPANAVISDHYPADAFERLLRSEGVVQLACRKCYNDSEWPCLGFLNERMLLALAFSAATSARPILVDSNSCAECSLRVSQNIADVVKKTNDVLCALGKRPVTIISPGTKLSFRSKTVSRRQFFSQLFGAAVTTVTEVMAPGTVAKSRMTDLNWFDHYARSNINSPTPVKQRLFKSLSISNLCDGCGICAGICPRKALAVQLDGHILQLQHDPVACAGCGVCIEHCPQKAISIGLADTLCGKLASSTELPLCRDCGSHYQPVGGHSVCMDCLLKAKIQVIW